MSAGACELFERSWLGRESAWSTARVCTWKNVCVQLLAGLDTMHLGLEACKCAAISYRPWASATVIFASLDILSFRRFSSFELAVANDWTHVQW
jgi:hypothetical protein